MPVLSGRVPVSGMGVARVPVRVETTDGRVAGLTTAEADGSWSVDLPAGDYVVAPRGFDPYTASTGGDTAAAGSSGLPEGSAAAARLARREGA